MATTPDVTVATFPDTDALVAAAGDRLAAAISEAIDHRGRAAIVLTGGGTGTALLKRLGTHPVDWARVHLFWGDDRFVPHDDDERNEKQARQALLDHIDIPAANVHPMAPSDGEYGGDIEAAARGYRDVLAANAESGAPTPVSMCICSEWAVRAISTRCSRTRPPSAKPIRWWSAWTTPPSLRRGGSP